MTAVLGDNEGLSALANCESSTRICDVVFVHGLGGGSHSTWMTSDAGQGFWPSWIGADFANVGVWTLGYRADVSAWTSESMPLADRGTAILETLANEGIGERPVVFITHSMGGILTKQILRHATSFGVKRWESIARNTRGIAFLATPHAGADLAGDAGIHDGVIDGTRVRFRTTHTPQFDDKPAEIRFEGTVTSNTLKMVVQDANGHGRVTARRKT